MLELTGTYLDPWSVMPPLTDADREWARANPGKFRYYTETGMKPGEARWPHDYVCGWGSDENGEINRAWLNPDYVPSPEYAFQPLTNEFELVMWRTIRGHQTFERFIELFSRQQFITILPEDDPNGERGWPIEMWNGKPEIRVFSSAAQLRKDVNPWLRREISGMQLLEDICPRPGMSVVVNPGEAAVMTIPGTDLLDLWRQWLDRHGHDAGTE